MNTFKKEDKLFLGLSCIFITLLVISNIIAIKTIIVGNLIVPAAVVCYALTFAISDTLAEIWGKEKTQYVVKIGFVASILASLFIQLAIYMPSSPFWEFQSQYALILGSNIRMVTASMLAYLLSQSHDVWAFHFWKEKTNGKYLWIRNNASTAVSQIIDTTIFIIVGFWGTGTPIFSLIVGQYAVKLIIAILDTPIVYALVYSIRKSIQKENTPSYSKTANVSRS